MSVSKEVSLNLDKIQRAFARVSRAIVGLKYLNPPAKQLLQTPATFGVKDSDDQEVNWNLILSDINKDKPSNEQVNHKSFLEWLGGAEADEGTGRVMLAYLIARLSTSLSRIAVLTTVVIEEVLDETGLSFEELVEELGITCPANPDDKDNHAMSQAYFDAMRIAAKEVMATRGYTSSRDIFAKAKTGKKINIGLSLGLGNKK